MIETYAAWPFFCCLAVVFVIASTPLFRVADSLPAKQKNRIASMDGMRGILALAVVFHHAAIYHRFIQDGVWTAPPSHFYALLGPVSVSLFFMITGFLFWSQLIRCGGRPSWSALYFGRVFRIGPLYLAALGVVLLVVANRSGYVVRVSIPILSIQLLRWLSLGAVSGKDINGYGHPELLMADVMWTLRWEWYFYLSLPVLAVLLRAAAYMKPRSSHLWFALFGLLGTQGTIMTGAEGPYLTYLRYANLFLLGMMSGSLLQAGIASRLPDRVGSSLIVILLLGVFFSSAQGVSAISGLMLGVILYLVVSGTSLFGLLTSTAAVRLGDISYGIYLLQGLVLAAIFRSKFSRIIDFASPIGHWALCLASSLILVYVAAVTHRLIELPGIMLGKRAVRRVWNQAKGV